MIDHIHERLISKKTSPFALSSISGILGLIVGVLALLGDLWWLVGEILESGFHIKHIGPMISFPCATILMMFSFNWIYKSVNMHLTREEKKQVRQDFMAVVRFKVEPDDIDPKQLDEQYSRTINN